MTTPDDEFRFLAMDARSVGASEVLPRVERLTLTLDDGRTLSALLRRSDRCPA